MATFSNIAYMALRFSGQLMPGTTPSPELLEDARLNANLIIDSWNADRLKCYEIDVQVFNITSSKLIYTMGAGGDFDPGYYPAKIENANFILSNSGIPSRVPIQIEVTDDWAGIPVLQVQSSIVNKIWIQRTYPLLSIHCFPYPTAANSFEFFMWKQFTKFAAANTTYAFPQAVEKAITDALAERMWLIGTKHLGVASNTLAVLEKNARLSKRELDKFNAPFVRMELDYSSSHKNGAPFNYLTGDFS